MQMREDASMELEAFKEGSYRKVISTIMVLDRVARADHSFLCFRWSLIGLFRSVDRARLMGYQTAAGDCHPRIGQAAPCVLPSLHRDEMDILTSPCSKLSQRLATSSLRSYERLDM
ncbi:hypothetical protein BDQ17DRAFT_1367239 [Cyathus striatus]|nr:hypothetical protein BDQ17DRAFT_1367239 [Cyathus striatus]